jgi:hypothetical protein
MVVKARFSRLTRRVAMAALLVVPVAITFSVRTARASGYAVAFDDYGNADCTPGGNDDCPD